MASRNNLNFGHSEYWRKNISAVESQELVRVLYALRKVGRHIATNLKPIEWSTSSTPNPLLIGIDINLAKGEYPVPPGKMDILVGITAREAFHCKILSDIVYINVKKKVGEISEGYKYLLDLLISIGEDIFTKEIAEDTVWKYYLSRCWPYVRPPFKSNTDKPTIHAFLHIFADYIFFDKLAVNMNPAYYDLFQICLDTRDAIKALLSESSISKRSFLRANIYLNLWNEILKRAETWVDEDSLSDASGLAEEFSGDEGDSCDDPAVDMESEENTDARRFTERENQALMQRVNDIMEEMDEKSINQEVADVAGEEEQWRIMDTVYGRATIPCRITADEALVARLKKIFRVQRSHRSRRYFYNRAQLLGKIDGRRLHRYSLDGKIFRKKEYLTHDNTRNIAILVDGSASMTGGLPGGGKEWAKTERLFLSLFEAVKGTGNRLDLLCYYERAGICEVNALVYGNRLYTVRPGGRTPTGQAIIATASIMPKDKKRLIVHLTDGEPNCGLSVQKSLEFCDKQGVDVVTIGTYFEEKTRDLLEKQYHDRAILIDSIDLLPEQLEAVLRANLLR